MRATVSTLVLALTLSSFGMAQQQTAPTDPMHGTPQTKPEASATTSAPAKPAHKKKKPAATANATTDTTTTPPDHGTPQTQGPK